MTTSNSKNSKSKSNKTSGSGPPKKLSSNVSGEHKKKPSQVIFATQDLYKAKQIKQNNVQQNPQKNVYYKSFDFVNQPELLVVIHENEKLTKEQMKQSILENQEKHYGNN